MIDLLESLEKHPPDWTIESLPLHHTRGRISDLSALVRSDNEETIALVHQGYAPIQNRDGLALAESLGYKFQGARVSHQGRRVFMLFGLDTIEMAGEEVSLHLCLANAHGSSLTTLGLESVDREAFLTPHLVFRRVACLNIFDSLWVARYNAPRIIPGNEESVSELKHWITENIDRSLEKAKGLLAARVTEEKVRDFSAYFRFLGGNHATDFMEVWRDTNDLAPIRHTGWGAYQAVAAYMTHHYPHASQDWWLLQDSPDYAYLADAHHFFEAREVPFMKWNPKTGSHHRLE